LLWFPTGGGKTEAYLGLTAFALAHRRLRSDPGGADASAGTGVLMRYTLRLLTLQQFQRAAALLCACEVMRRADERKWGQRPFTIGLWVGESVTPNYYEEAKEALAKLRRGERVYEGSPYQVLFCPWCGTDLTPQDYASDDDLERTFVRCSNPDCEFRTARSAYGLPVLLVDEEIYRHPPSLLLATVDKFAQLAWNPRIQALFGQVNRFCPRHGFLTPADDHPVRHNETRGWPAADVLPTEARLAPADLIIQDELHLISGPLGTLVGIYESVVEGLCTRRISGREVRPKVIASTATIRRASSQFEALFDRKMHIFPPLGLDADDSYFAQEDKTHPGRLYVGVYAPGKSVKTALVRAYSAMLSRAKFEFDAVPEQEAELKTEADSYLTLVGYFNSLRELGGALRLVDDDVRARIRVLYKRGFSPNRLIYEVKELTSRKRSFEIAETLKQMDRTFMKVERGVYPIDVLLASNMLSVGVDIDRLSLMVVSAQPKTSAEYIQATSRVGRVHPGIVVEVYNWIRPRDISHYERFVHYHDTFYRHVEATSVTPFSLRARDRALPAVFVSWIRQTVMNLAREQEANNFRSVIIDVQDIIENVAARAGRVTERADVEEHTRQKLKNLAGEWEALTSPRRPVVYTGRGLKPNDNTKTVLLSHMEAAHPRGIWVAAGSLREVETEVDVILTDEPGELNGH
ncbi:MAG: helicase-related protein, partial [bacterium]